MQDALNEMVLNVALACITLLATYATYYIRKATRKVLTETSKLTDESQRALIQAAIDRLDDVATKTVQNFEQTVAKELRQAVKEGRTSRDDLLQLSHQAYTEIVTQLKPEYLEALSSTMGDAERYIMSTIESKVLELKERAG
ncbi:guanylate kinase [Paenibacillus apiarius]|uniref:guanylate kinase n=1 Tax=Paenibacillus apiarius TaxID=46240 RepID=UPI003B3BE9EE